MASPAARTSAAIRLGALLAFAAFGLHQFRYLLANGSATSEQLARQGHDYLAGALPVLLALLVAALAATVLRARFSAGRARPPFGRRAFAYAFAILAVYCSQELLEGALAAGHPAGVAALSAGAGWIALPLALLFGAGLALLVVALEGLETVLAPVVCRRRRKLAPRIRGRARVGRRPSSQLSPLAFGLARRPPPALVDPG